MKTSTVKTKADYAAAIETAFAERTVYLAAIRATIDAAIATVDKESDEYKDKLKPELVAVNKRQRELAELGVATMQNADNLNTLFALRIDMVALLNEANRATRESKARIRKCLVAMSAGEFAENGSKAEYAFFSAVAFNQIPVEMSYEQCRVAMSHAGFTQTRYMRDFLKCVKSCGAEHGYKNDDIPEPVKRFTVDVNSGFIKRLMRRSFNVAYNADTASYEQIAK